MLALLERREMGGLNVDIHVDDHDTWNLNYTAAVLLLPLLKAYRAQEATHYGTWGTLVEGDMFEATEEQWAVAHKRQFELLDDMIYAFGRWADPDSSGEDADPRVRAGLAAFAEHFGNLWN